MGTGKSTVARYLGKTQHMEIIEMDEEIAHREGKSIPDIFAEKGEAYFRDLESHLLKELQRETNQILSCGGGIVLRPENITQMKKNGKVILLTASPETVLERVKHENSRPVLKNRKNTVPVLWTNAGTSTWQPRIWLFPQTTKAFLKSARKS